MRKIIIGGCVIFVGALGGDYGKHWYFKKFLENQMQSTSARVTADKIELSFKPFATQIHITGLTLKNDQGVFHVKDVTLRQKLHQFRGAYVKGEQLTLTDYVTVSQLQGILQVNRDNSEWIFEGDPFQLTAVQTHLPKVQLQAKILETNWRYFTKSREIDFTFNAPQFEIENDEAISLHGSGRVNLMKKPKGNVDVRVSGIEQLSHALVKNKIISKTQGQLITFSGQLFGGKDGEVPLPLRFEAGKFYIGPVEIG
jgi:hypothetical protein